MMTSKELRKKFIDFFVSRGHKKMPSASLMPQDDISVLFTTAGMQQFKKYYLNPAAAPSKRVATVQACLRTSDIEGVGDTTHLTFFEMLGNFSFNDYGKSEAIKWALEFLTAQMGIKKERLTASYFAGGKGIKEDLESKNILEKLGFSGDKLIKAGKEDNFWGPVGNEGACGPTVEFYVKGVEIWNLVFNEFVLRKGKYHAGKYKGVDTGMGLERALAVANELDNIFESDVLAPLIKIVEKRSSSPDQKSVRIITDHLRGAFFLAAEGLEPSNKDQGYILRRLIRRAAAHGKKMDCNLTDILGQFSKTLFDIYQVDMGAAEATIAKELKSFTRTLKRGIKEFGKIVKSADTQISGKDAFYLFETFGFPLELTQELAKEDKKMVDEKGFQLARDRHRQKSRASARRFKGGLSDAGEIETRYHTATHLLLAALRKVLGEHVEQKGSNINRERLRFDFSHPEKMTSEQIKQVEKLVNQKINQKLPVTMEEMSLEEAKEQGATGVFEDRYGDRVKVYTILDKNNQPFSKEICGGPHVKNTSEIGRFKIIKEQSSSAGIRRIRAKLV